MCFFVLNMLPINENCKAGENLFGLKMAGKLERFPLQSCYV